jgi:hypothetical protein
MRRPAATVFAIPRAPGIRPDFRPSQANLWMWFFTLPFPGSASLHAEPFPAPVLAHHASHQAPHQEVPRS